MESVGLDGSGAGADAVPLLLFIYLFILIFFVQSKRAARPVPAGMRVHAPLLAPLAAARRSGRFMRRRLDRAVCRPRAAGGRGGPGGVSYGASRAP